MRRIGEWVLVVGLLSGLSTGAAEEAESQAAATNAVAAADLWAGMHATGMIDDEQYQHVLATGRLPGGTTVSDSPVAVEEQAEWNKLAEAEVISPDELASMLFGGDIPGLTVEEERAFVELAPVYQPKRSKRLTYDIRRKHARVELIRLAHSIRNKAQALEDRASLLGIPLESTDGVLLYIDESGTPHYSGSSGLATCDTISSDEVWPTNILGEAWNTNFYLSGAGVTLAMWELGGVMEDHQEFAGRVDDKTSGVTDPWFHANTVAAIMVGAGVTNDSQGMAPAATLNAHNRLKTDHLSDVAIVAGFESICEATTPPTTNMVRLSNHSYEQFKTPSFFSMYTDKDKECDRIVYEAYYHLLVWAAGNYGNNGYDSIAGGIAKNVLCVGAIEELEGGYSGASNVVLVAKSGRGPTDDNRIKPDLVAGGSAGGEIPDFEGDVDDYYYYNGYATSYAAPAVTGSLGLLQELHERLNGTNAPLLASTYKAIAIHTADEAGDAPGPDYRFGWGVMNTLSAAELMVENSQWNYNPLIMEPMLPSGEHISFTVEVGSNQTFRTTTCWSDPPGEGLINDLDLRIIAPSGQTNFPWVLNPTNGFRANPAATGDNIVDNVEQVEITNTVAGTYTVLINHKGTLFEWVDEGEELIEGGQEASIILSGILPINIDVNVAYSIGTNGFPRLDITNAIGSVYEISRIDELRHSSWTQVDESPLSVLRPQVEWSDPGISTNSMQFYKYNQVR